MAEGYENNAYPPVRKIFHEYYANSGTLDFALDQPYEAGFLVYNSFTASGSNGFWMITSLANSIRITPIVNNSAVTFTVVDNTHMKISYPGYSDIAICYLT